MCLSIEINRPDHVLAKGNAHGFKWVVVHNGLGFRCGYVRVGKDHPWYGVDYNEVNANVHGGLTFSEHDVSCGKGADDGYWVGFDCAHCDDAQDPSLPRECPMEWGGTIRTTEYVIAECVQLCAQAEAAAKPKTPSKRQIKI